ncbi:MAG: SufD family Fe-S cluster assembly protein [Candidatus Bathyarchaeota archaeon]|nr:SufD family Fe-S cluster assembly protein [Candidatus Bathyarchaeota archaeon]
MSKSKEDASKARDKPATLGPDIDISQFSRQTENWSPCSLSNLPKEVLERAFEVGIIPEEKSRSATYFQLDHSVISQAVQDTFKDEVEIMSTAEALKRYDWFREYWWNLVKVDADKYTSLAETQWDQGYFIRILEGRKVTVPLQACLFVSTDNLNQNVHNVIVAEPGSEAQLITGCAVHPNVHRGLHVGVSEFYVKEDAKLTFTMIHRWAQGFDSRPRSAVLVEDNASFVSNYMCFKPVKSLQMYPVAYCKGVNSRVSFNSILYGSRNSYIDTGAKIVLQNKGSRGEIVTRAISTDNAQIYARGFLQGEHESSRAHLECRGLLMSDKAMIYAVPELLARAQGANLSHEAAVGKIAEEQIQYLMARGFSEDEAEALIVRGFMDVSIFGLPEELENDIKKMVNITAERAL